MQPKLLRVLEDGVMRHLSASQHSKVDVRSLSATNDEKDILRKDLFYRLARYTVQLSPLRERMQDVALPRATCASPMPIANHRPVAPRE